MFKNLQYSFQWAILFVLPAMLQCVDLSAQCPDEQTLLLRINTVSSSSPKEQIKEYSKTLDSVKNCSTINDTVKAFLLKKIGAQYYYEQDYTNALKYYREYVNIAANEGKPKVQVKYIVAGYYFLSAMLQGLNRNNEAWTAIDSCMVIADRYGFVDGSNLAALYKKMERYYDAGDYYNCINYCLKCELLADRFAKTAVGRELVLANEFLSSSLLWRIKALLELKKYDEVEKLLEKKFNEYKKMGDKKYYGTIYSQLAEMEEHRGNYAKSLSYYNKSIISHKEVGDNFNCKQTEKDIATKIYVNHYNDLNSALNSYRKAIGYINNDKSKLEADVFESLDIYTGIANLYVYKGLFDSAQYYFQLAFDKLKPGINETLILKENPDELRSYKKIHYLTSLVIDKADAYRNAYITHNKQDLLKEAIRIYKCADALLDRVKMGQIDLNSKLFWRSDTRRLYENAIDACYRSGNTSDAFYFFEKSRAVLLNDQLVNQHWLNQDDISMQTSINKKIVKLERESLNADPQSAAYRDLQQQLFKSKTELEHFDLLIKKNNPLYYQSFLDTFNVSIDMIRKMLLNDHQSMVEIFEGDSAVYSIVITSGDARTNKIDKTGFDELSNLFTKYISDPVLLNRQFDSFLKISQQLHDLIFKNNPLPQGRVIISPSGKYFPFEALVTSGSSKPVKYFLDDFAVSYTYSARYLLNQFETNATATGRNFMGIAPVNYAKTYNMSTLSGSDNSLDRIGSLVGEAYSLVYQQATRNNFLQQFPSYRIIQLYTHASDSSDNREPVIYFADSAIYLSELIPEIKPVTQLVVLSACETGNGIDYQGEGVFSFNRGFAALGIPSSIMNLWSVDNESTYTLNELFYKYLVKGLPLDVAMQKAKIDFIKSGSKKNLLPYYWAGPVLAGKSDAIDYKKPVSWRYFIFPLMITIAVFIGWIFLRKKNNASVK